ncbi:hypothetical protein [Listeria riparia]|uniref:Uncharacterized protein n=1 Tax=Listeria riparia FSL S10-1204 TaxID=1265816 RepID=W7DCD6_9LIST|nr:hypothetical protein [Listeria riparia]EUJ42943.1 hypothetical protein PRIP_14857 [Listeria riparia FSL S10-1204]
MADIKDLNIFGNRNKGLAQIKKAAQQKKASDKENEVNLPDTETVETETKTQENEASSPTPSLENIEREETSKATKRIYRYH